MTIEYQRYNFRVKNIFPKVPSRGVKVGQNKRYWHFKVLQSAPCWYFKLVSRDAWFNGKGLSSIGWSCAEKTSKMCKNIGNCQNRKYWQLSIQKIDALLNKMRIFHLNSILRILCSPYPNLLWTLHSILIFLLNLPLTQCPFWLSGAISSWSLVFSLSLSFNLSFYKALR